MRISRCLAKKISLSFLAFATVIGFQNCNQVQFSIDKGSLALSSANNGSGYGGKVSRNYNRFDPGFSCENKEAPVSSLAVQDTDVIQVLNKQLQCGAVSRTFDTSQLDFSIYENDLVGYQEGIFEFQPDLFTSIPANLVEVWCRDSKLETSIETITHYNRNTQQADTKIYYTVAGSQLSQNRVVSRVVGNKLVTVSDGSDLLLEVHRDQPAAELGLFQAQLSVTLNGVKQTRATSCRLGGSLDPNLWPSQQIVDMNVNQLKFSKDFSFFAYTSSTGSTAFQLYSADSAGTRHQRSAPVMNTRGVDRFEISPDMSSLLYWGDSRVPAITELFKVSRDGSGLLQLNEPNPNGIRYSDPDIQFSPDGSAVFYEDDHQETGPDVERWLRSVPLSGGTPTVINPPLPLAGDIAVYQYGLSKAYGKVAYLSGDIFPDLFIANLDGSSTLKAPIVYRSSSWHINWFAHFDIPAPGLYAIVPVQNFSPSTPSPWQILEAVAMDGSSSMELPAGFVFHSASPDGRRLLLRKEDQGTTINQDVFYQMQIVTPESQKILDLSLIEGHPIFSQDSLSLVVTKLDAGGNPRPYQISLIDGSERPLCNNLNGSNFSFTENGANTWLLTSFNPQNNILDVYSRDAAGNCKKPNSLPMPAAPTKRIEMSADQSKILLKASSQVSGHPHDLLYLIPLSGEIPYQVNTPVFFGAQINEFRFLDDSKRVFFMGDQIVPNENNVFVWKIP